MTPTMHRLIDGIEVSGDSEAWRHECEARAIALLSTREERDMWLAAIAVKRGEPEAERLRAKVKQILEGARR